METGRRTLNDAPVLVLMGVSGSGKSTVAGVLAGRLGWDLADGDDLHLPREIEKMVGGHALTDADRVTWLDRVAAWIGAHIETGRPGIIACSALKRRYRDVLRASQVEFVYLAGSREQIDRRLAARHGHFMPPALLDSQFTDLEPPGPDEQAIRVDIGKSPVEQAEMIIAALGLRDDPASPRSG